MLELNKIYKGNWIELAEQLDDESKGLYMTYTLLYGMRDTLSYLAGIIDGEGYVGIKKSHRLKTCPSPTYHERIQIRMVEEKAINLFKEVFGGNYYKEKPHSTKGKLLYCYQASDLIASKIIKKILPYLLIKKKQAKNVLLLRKNKEQNKHKPRGSPRGNLMDKKILEYREGLYSEGKRLNA